MLLTRLATGIDTLIINDGSAQRSTIRSITVTFGGVVSLPPTPSDAFQLTRTGPGSPTSVTVNVDTSLSTPNKTIAKLTFPPGPQTEFASLIDGNYSLAVFGAQILDQGGQPVDADNNGTPGGNNINIFHRLFGDGDGNKIVDGVDFGAFRSAFNTTNQGFDYDNSGTVDGTDFGQFRQQFNKSLP